MDGVVVFDRSALQRTIRGVVFDMDGTLTVPVIDFQYMRQVCDIWGVVVGDVWEGVMFIGNGYGDGDGGTGGA